MGGKRCLAGGVGHAGNLWRVYRRPSPADASTKTPARVCPRMDFQPHRVPVHGDLCFGNGFLGLESCHTHISGDSGLDFLFCAAVGTSDGGDAAADSLP